MGGGSVVGARVVGGVVVVGRVVGLVVGLMVGRGVVGQAIVYSILNPVRFGP